jgi:haloalkane dehalogenase
MAQTTDWTFDGTWPFEPKWFETEDGRMHYVDEGPQDGTPVVLLSGNPCWAYLYREAIPALVTAGHRAIAVDHLGFGRSDKPADPELYRIPRHIARMDALLESLDLKGAVLAANDWGGPIGLAWAIRHPERVDGLFMHNTYVCAPPVKARMPVPLKIVRMPVLGEIGVKRLDVVKRVVMFRAAIVQKQRLTATVKRAYLAPHPDAASRTAMLVFPREIPGGPTGPVAELLREIETGVRDHFRSKSVRIVWGEKDIVLPPAVLDVEWKGTFPDVEPLRIADAGHYVLEDAPETVIPALIELVEEASVAPADQVPG